MTQEVLEQKTTKRAQPRDILEILGSVPLKEVPMEVYTADDKKTRRTLSRIAKSTMSVRKDLRIMTKLADVGKIMMVELMKSLPEDEQHHVILPKFVIKIKTILKFRVDSKKVLYFFLKRGDGINHLRALARSGAIQFNKDKLEEYCADKGVALPKEWGSRQPAYDRVEIFKSDK